MFLWLAVQKPSGRCSTAAAAVGTPAFTNQNVNNFASKVTKAVKAVITSLMEVFRCLWKTASHKKILFLTRKTVINKMFICVTLSCDSDSQAVIRLPRTAMAC